MKTITKYPVFQLNNGDTPTYFRKRFHSNYEFIYDMYDEIQEMGVAYDEGVKFLKDHNNYELIHDILGDWPISDREIRTLAFTLREFGVIDF